MNKFLYPIKNLEIMPWIKYWLLKRGSTPSYPLSEIITGVSPLTLINSVRKKFNIFNISGNTIQDGTPTPDNPIPVENVSGEVEVKVENKNFIDLSDKSGTHNEDGSLTVKNTTSSAIAGITVGLTGKIPAGNYIFSNISGGAAFLQDKTHSGYTTQINVGSTFAIEYDGTSTLRFVFANQAANSTRTYKLQLEPGSIVTEYAKHEEQTATLHLPEGMEMCKIGTYQDSFVYQGGKWYKNKVIGSSGVSASWAWDKNADSPDGNYISFMAYEAPWKKASTNSLCNYFVTGYWNTISQKNGNYCWNNGSVVGGFRIHKDYLEGYDASMTNAEKIALFKTWLRNSSDLKVYYKLDTPLLQEITDTTLISDLNSLKDLYSYNGTTYISSNNEPSPIFEVQYYMEGE